MASFCGFVAIFLHMILALRKNSHCGFLKSESWAWNTPVNLEGIKNCRSEIELFLTVDYMLIYWSLGFPLLPTGPLGVYVAIDSLQELKKVLTDNTRRIGKPELIVFFHFLDNHAK